MTLSVIIKPLESQGKRTFKNDRIGSRVIAFEASLTLRKVLSSPGNGSAGKKHRRKPVLIRLILFSLRSLWGFYKNLPAARKKDLSIKSERVDLRTFMNLISPQAGAAGAAEHVFPGSALAAAVAENLIALVREFLKQELLMHLLNAALA